MDTKKSRLKAFAKRHWQPLSMFGAVFLAVAAALVWRLGSLVPGYSANEVQAYQQSLSLSAIWNNPLDAPYHILTYLFMHIVPNNLLAVRLSSITIAWLSVVIFCILLYRWYGTRAALIGTLLFGTSSWLLHVGRLGTPQVCFLAIIALVACGVWIREQKGGLAVIIGLLLATVLLYTPGMVWFIVVGLLWQWRHIDTAFKKHLGSVSLGGLVFLTGIAPLVWHLYKSPELIKTWLALPAQWQSIEQYLRNFAEVPLAIFLRGQQNPELWLGRLPLLSIFGIVCFILGMYIFWKYFKLARVKLCITLGFLGSIIIALSDGGVPLTVLAPFIYIVVTLGASYIIDLWLHVFPRNPIARQLGIGMFSAVLLITVTYNLRSYFVAWPQATVTRNVFVHTNKQ